mmetsp:Transcript_60051/g.190768  ORF Transcript_60051/g.190768 Transcript_60051/m.190768 type:complete len:303 (-) Transcript_60051:1662-2570(-)
MRLPSTFCCPTHAIICEMLMKDPLDPAVTICFTLLFSERERCALLPASSRALLSSWLTLFSKDSTMVRPGCAGSCLACACWMRSRTFALAAAMRSLIVSIVFTSATVSPMPMLKLCCSSQWLMSVCVCERNARAASGPISSQITWMSPPPPLPTVFLHTMPARSSPRSMRTQVSAGDMFSSVSASSCHALVLRRFTWGMMRLKTCLPVHSGVGLRMAGIGTRPSNSSSHIIMFMKRSFSMNVSRLVICRHPRRVSCTMPITGLFACGETTILGTIMSSMHSARVSHVCATCMFISSPSKSAL